MNPKATHPRRRSRQSLLLAAPLCAATLLGASNAPARGASLVPPASGPCSLQNTARAVVAKIEPNLDITLADGRVVSLAGLDPPHDTPAHPRLAAEARDTLAQWLEGGEVSVRALAGPNRWGRTPARLFAAPPGATEADEIGLAEALLDAGLARYRPELAAHPCRAELLAAEAELATRRLVSGPIHIMRSSPPGTAPPLRFCRAAWCLLKARRRASVRPRPDST